jgi:hypothetical protein
MPARELPRQRRSIVPGRGLGGGFILPCLSAQRVSSLHAHLLSFSPVYEEFVVSMLNSRASLMYTRICYFSAQVPNFSCTSLLLSLLSLPIEYVLVGF